MIFKKYIFKTFMYSFLMARGLRCFEGSFSSCGELRLLFIAVASLVVEHGI